MKRLFLLLLAVCPLQAFAAPGLNDAFFDTCQSAALSDADPRIFKGIGGWYFLKAELAHIAKREFWGARSRDVSLSTKPDSADPVPAIVDFNNQLKAKGIELILLPVPAKAFVYPDKLDASLKAPGSERLDYYHVRFYDVLKKQGVKVLDIMPLLLNERAMGNKVYCETDAHWSAYACEIAASELAGMLKSASWYAEIPKRKMNAAEKTIRISGDLVTNEEPKLTEDLAVRVITDGTGQYIEAAEASPVILMGDSHTLVFHDGGDMLCEGAGLFDQLAYELAFAPDLIGVRGSGSTASRVNLFRKSKYYAEYLADKKVVIWCITVREFTESPSGWKLVPVSP